ncbi:unnamed protein product [Cuscuta epithymum]|uniref:Late embryogenesis abundant protein LEA-2 subgroup domain-containing protein n=1 Tax=Cuscuta epithymum TaxID=186058 RepID=A0AAV0GC85_9ASTE|nr:unnamed protein product [Cuscuta epithymum]CAH9145586.1 unnamed protein product [Cuscuta epithymum]
MDAYKRKVLEYCCVFFAAICICVPVVYFMIIDSLRNPDPKAPAFSVVAAPLTTNDSRSRFTGGNLTFILNTRNRNQKYTNDYDTTEASLYLDGAHAAQREVANATLGAFFLRPGASSNLTLTFPAPGAVLGDGSTAIIKMKVRIRFRDRKKYGRLQVSCDLPYSSQLQGFDVSRESCDVSYFPPEFCWIDWQLGTQSCERYD